MYSFVSARVRAAAKGLARRALVPAFLAFAFACGSSSTGPEDAGDHQPAVSMTSPMGAEAPQMDASTAPERAGAGGAAGSEGGPTAAGGAGSLAGGSGGTAGSAGATSDTAMQAGSASGSGANANTAGMGAAGSGGQAGSAAEPGSRRFVGNITTNGQVRDDFARYWDQITPENEGKWGSVEGTRGQMNWDGLDRAYAYAKQHAIPFKQHTFVWGSQQPSWIATLSRAEQRAEVEEWIRLYCERYPDTALIDVVNEPPPHTTPTYMDALGGAGDSGYDWIIQAFKWSRQYCPNAILMLNDYNNIEYGGDNERFLDIVERIRNAGAPIDALGAQAHDAHKLSADVVQGFLDKLSATGLPVYITEYDIDVADDARQREIMQEQFPLFWDDKRIVGITLWGYVVGATWRPNTGLMTADGKERPALTWLREQLER